MKTEWFKIRSYNGSQSNAFEELVCQLAHSEKPTNAHRFVRKGTPDGGVECYWILSDESEHCWQAKYFFRFDQTQINQIQESFYTAIAKHPKLTHYYVCLPFDFSDPRIEGVEHAKDRWDKKKAEWEAHATTQGKSVSIELWGSFELDEKLTQEKHAGRRGYWFNEIELSENWLNQRLEESIQNLGKRYTPQLNFELEIAHVFDGLARDTVHQHKFYNLIREFFSKANTVVDALRDAETEPFKADLQAQIIYAKEIVQKFDFDDIDNTIDIDGLRAAVEKIEETISYISAVIYDYERKRWAEKDEEARNKGEKVNQYRQYEKFSSLIGDTNKVQEYINKVNRFLELTATHLLNDPLLLVTGEAGIGKSHLLADVARKRQRNSQSTILLLGQHFVKGDPWVFIQQQLFPGVNREHFLGALNAKAQSQGSRILIMIDAINEGDGKYFWKEHISGFVNSFKPYKWLGVVLSVRSSYKDFIIPSDLDIETETHYGFNENEYEATKLFFEYYGIQQPSIPLLHPEFTKPLYLRLFCEGLSKAGLRVVPPGHEGINKVIGFYLDAINTKLSAPSYFGFNPKLNTIQKVAELVANAIATLGRRHLTLEEANELVESFASKQRIMAGLLDQMVSEGIFTQNLTYNSDTKQYEEGIYLAYERFQDHLYASHIIRECGSENQAEQLAEKIQALFKDEWEIHYHLGVLQALSIQIPETVGVEIFEIAESICHNHYAAQAIIQALIWRIPQSIQKEKLVTFFNKVSSEHVELHDEILELLISITGQTSNPFNADYLHEHLMKQSMPDRDSGWSVYLHNRFINYDNCSVRRLIDWSWEVEEKSYLNKESRTLLAKTIVWFFTSSNRFLRDKATKALVALLEGHYDILIEVFEAFKGVDDMYIWDRLYATAMGLVLRGNSDESTKLVQYIYDITFADGNVPVHLLIRDYAKTTIEYALNKQFSITVDKALVYPPYNSTWPEHIPTRDDLKKYELEWTTNENRGQNHIFQSVMGYDDFSRYVIGDRYDMDFLELDLKRFNKGKNFPSTLKLGLKRGYKTYSEIYKFKNKTGSNFRVPSYYSKEEWDDLIKSMSDSVTFLEKEIGRRLTAEQKNVFENDVPYYLDAVYSSETRSNHLPTESISCFILNRVFELGYDKELFGEFDYGVNSHYSYGRSDRKPERIGKKYQWIAYHEIMARVTDNFVYKDSLSSDEPADYEGPWQLLRRDIDPTNLIPKQVEASSRARIGGDDWWVDVEYNNWNTPVAEWLAERNDLPDFAKLIEVEHNGEKWLNLQSFPSWDEPENTGVLEKRLVKMHLWTHLRSYLVRKSQKQKLLKWMRQQHIMGRWMPESSTYHRMFLRELIWSSSYQVYDSGKYWYSLDKGADPKAKVLVTVDEYTWERGYDCSIEETVSVLYPSKFLFDLLKLQFSKSDEAFVDADGQIVAINSSVRKNLGPYGLLVKKDFLLNVLTENKLDIVWTVLGEKQTLYDYDRNVPDFLEFSGTYSVEDAGVTGTIISRRRSEGD